MEIRLFLLCRFIKLHIFIFHSTRYHPGNTIINKAMYVNQISGFFVQNWVIFHNFLYLWMPGPESNRRITGLQSAALPFCHLAVIYVERNDYKKSCLNALYRAYEGIILTFIILLPDLP